MSVFYFSGRPASGCHCPAAKKRHLCTVRDSELDKKYT